MWGIFTLGGRLMVPSKMMPLNGTSYGTKGALAAALALGLDGPGHFRPEKGGGAVASPNAGVYSHFVTANAVHQTTRAVPAATRRLITMA